jgi:hypothetical protein
LAGFSSQLLASLCQVVIWLKNANKFGEMTQRHAIPPRPKSTFAFSAEVDEDEMSFLKYLGGGPRKRAKTDEL